MSTLRAGGLVLVALLVAGCSGSGTTKVTGVVTVAGAPMEGLAVSFHPESGRPASGVTDAQGKFSLSTLEPNDGAVPGNHKVAITKGAAASSEPPPMPGTPDYVEPSAAASTSPFDPKYEKPETSGLTAVVEKGKTNDFKFDLQKAQ